MEEDMQHFQHIMLTISRKVKTQLKRTKKVCEVCGDGAVTDRTCEKPSATFLGTIDILVK